MDNKIQKDAISESDNDFIRECLIELRDDKIEEFIKSRPLTLEEFNLRFSLELGVDSIKPYEQMQFMDEIFEILGSIDEKED